jgi:transposase
MPGPKPLAINLNDVERQGLELLVRRYTTGQQKVIRARIVLLAAIGKNNREIANELQVSLDTARLWRQRWLDLQPISLDDLSIEERLDDLPRPGAPPRLTANQICQIQQLACEKPEKSGRPISQWTSREIAAEIMRRGIVDTISARHSARILKKMPSTALDSLLANTCTGRAVRRKGGRYQFIVSKSPKFSSER